MNYIQIVCTTAFDSTYNISLALFQNICCIMLVKLLPLHKDTIVNIPVDEDQAVPDPRDNSKSMISTPLAPYNLNFSGQSLRVPEQKMRAFNFRAVIRPKAALEEVYDALENKVASLLHLEGDSVAVKPGNDEEATLVVVLNKGKVGINN